MPTVLPGGVNVYTTAEWGAAAPNAAFPDTTPTNMVVHHMVYPNREPIADPDAAVQAAYLLARRCQHDHMANNGWSDTGQHFTVSIDGIICEGRHGSLDALLAHHCIHGSHAYDAGPPPIGDNQSWGTEHEGTYDVVHMPPAQWDASVKLHAAIAMLCDLDTATIIGHRDTGIATDCPGNWFHAQLPQFRAQAHDAKVQLLNV